MATFVESLRKRQATKRRKHLRVVLKACADEHGETLTHRCRTVLQRTGDGTPKGAERERVQAILDAS